jgi:hypothetical protein
LVAFFPSSLVFLGVLDLFASSEHHLPSRNSRGFIKKGR